MSQYRYAFERKPMRQHGAALIVGLVLLVVVTLVGVSAMQSTTLQEKMAGNLRDSNLAFQASEAALRNCENILAQDYQQQVANLNTGVLTAPPQNPARDQAWCLGQPNLLPTDPACVSGQGAWMWSLDENQAVALFPGLAANRLDPAPANLQFWWAERADPWWQNAALSNSQTLAPNTLDGLFNNQQPRCILEAYAYAPADMNQTAEAFRRMRFADGITIKNELQFRRERNYFRMTSRGQGGSQTAVSLLQSGVYQIYFVQN